MKEALAGGRGLARRHSPRPRRTTLGQGPLPPEGPEQPLGGGGGGRASPALCRVAQSPREVTVPATPAYSLAWEHGVGSQSPVSKGLEVQVEPYDPTSQKGKWRPRGFHFVARALGRGAETLVPGVPAQGGPHVLPARGRTEKGWKAGCDHVRVCPSLSPTGALGTLASGAGGVGTRAGCEVPASEGAVETSSTSAL